MPRRSQDEIGRLAVVSLVCCIAGILLATAASLGGRQFALAASLFVIVAGLAILVAQRGRALDHALVSMLAAGAVSLVLGFALLRLLVTYSMDEPSFQAGVDSTADTRSTATATLIETQEPAVTASPEVTLVVTPELAAAATPELAAATTPEPAAAVSCGQATVAGVGSLNIRAEPNLTSPVLGNRAAGSVVELLCDAPVEVNGLPWRHVRSENVEGWMSERYLQVAPAPGG
jgi:hypothetical protein